MFKNRAIQVKMVKTSKNEDTSEPIEERVHVDPEQINKIAKDFVTHTAIVVGAVVVGTTVLNTLSKIAIITAKAKIR